MFYVKPLLAMQKISIKDTEKKWERNEIMSLQKNIKGTEWKTREKGMALVWLSGLSASLLTEWSLVQFPVRAQAWVVGQEPGKGHVRGNHTLMFLSLS